MRSAPPAGDEEEVGSADRPVSAAASASFPAGLTRRHGSGGLGEDPQPQLPRDREAPVRGAKAN